MRGDQKLALMITSAISIFAGNAQSKQVAPSSKNPNLIEQPRFYKLPDMPDHKKKWLAEIAKKRQMEAFEKDETIDPLFKSLVLEKYELEKYRDIQEEKLERVSEKVDKLARLEGLLRFQRQKRSFGGDTRVNTRGPMFDFRNLTGFNWVVNLNDEQRIYEIFGLTQDPTIIESPYVYKKSIELSDKFAKKMDWSWKTDQQTRDNLDYRQYKRDVRTSTKFRKNGRIAQVDQSANQSNNNRYQNTYFRGNEYINRQISTPKMANFLGASLDGAVDWHMKAEEEQALLKQDIYGFEAYQDRDSHFKSGNKIQTSLQEEIDAIDQEIKERAEFINSQGALEYDAIDNKNDLFEVDNLELAMNIEQGIDQGFNETAGAVTAYQAEALNDKDIQIKNIFIQNPTA